jgi:hypothetical protein
MIKQGLILEGVLLVTKLQLGNRSEEVPASPKLEGSWSFPVVITKLELGNEEPRFPSKNH